MSTSERVGICPCLGFLRHRTFSRVVKFPVPIQWANNDVLGYLYNGVYYQVFDSVIKAWINARYRG